MAASRNLSYCLLTIDLVGGRHVARSFVPPNGARNDWEFGSETYVEVLATALNSFAGRGWKLDAVDTTAEQTIYILVRDAVNGRS